MPDAVLIFIGPGISLYSIEQGKYGIGLIATHLCHPFKIAQGTQHVTHVVFGNTPSVIWG